MKMVCIKQGQWLTHVGSRPMKYRCPNYGEIVEVEGKRLAHGNTFLLLVGYHETNKRGVRIAYNAERFRKLISDEPKACSKEFLKLINKVSA